MPFLTYSEFIRAKLKNWMMYASPFRPRLSTFVLIISFSSRGSEKDASDIIFVLTHAWDRVDINRIPEQDMDQFAARNGSVTQAWAALRKRFRH